MSQSKLVGAFAAAGLALISTVPDSAAQSGAAFFDGKTVNYIVTIDPGGGFDTYGRLVAEYMEKHLPGSTFVVRNMPGAGHILGTNYLYASAADGLTIGTFNTGLVYSQLAGVGGVRFDLREMSWIGKAASDPRMIIVSSESEITDIEALMSNESVVRFAAEGVGSGSYVETLMLQRVLDLPVEMITGYSGSEAQLGMMRGEVQGAVAFHSSYEPFIIEGNGRFLAQIGGTLADIPQLGDMATSPEAKSVVELIAAQGSIARLTAGPPGIPEDRLEALRTAYAQAVTDREFLERAAQLRLPIDPLVGEPVREAIIDAFDQPPAVVEMISRSLAE